MIIVSATAATPSAAGSDWRRVGEKAGRCTRPSKEGKMARLKIHSVTQILMLVVFCVAPAMMGLALRNKNTSDPKPSRLPTLQQSDEKVIKRQQRQNEPIELSDLSVQNINVLLNEKINVNTLPDNKSWLKNLQFTIKNKSGKQITYIHYSIVFPQAIIKGGVAVYTKDVGVSPPSLLGGRKNIKPLAINPEDTFKVTLSDSDLTWINNFLSDATLQLADVTEVNLRIDVFVVEDGMKWDSGYWYKPNPSKPSGYERMEQ